MKQEILEALMQLVVILPLVVYFANANNSKTKKFLFLFFTFFIGYRILLVLPIYFPYINFLKGEWNWTGKTLAIIGSLIFYYTFKKDLIPNNYLILKQKKNTIKKNVLIILLLTSVIILMGILSEKQVWNLETILFQSTLPGIDEEIAYRGVMLGILSSILIEKKQLFNTIEFNPSIWIIGILFGLVHALRLNLEWEVSFNTIHFLITFIFGTIWSWMVIKSKSILLPMISHNLSNVLPNLIGMLK